jgi:cytoskeletal protein CcmA (bactofilin family)
LSSRAPGARVPRSTADQPPPAADPSGEHNSVTLGPRDRLIGQLHIEGDIRLGGTVEGQIDATGDVEIDEEAKVTASVAGRDVSIRGQVNGHVTARKRLVVAKSGSLTGDVRVARLMIQDGATFSGNVSMGPAVDLAPKPQPQAPVEPPAPQAAAPQAAEPQPAPPRSAAPQPAPAKVAAPPPPPPAPAKVAAPPPPPPASARDGNRPAGASSGSKPAPSKGKPVGGTGSKGKTKR